MNEESVSNLLNALAAVIQNESSEEMKQLRMQILKRTAEEATTVTPRMPAPLNITEIGGYYNLLSRLGNETIDMRKRLIAAALGIPLT